MKYKIGDRVRIKSLDWYNENKDEGGYIWFDNAVFVGGQSLYCGCELTICSVTDDSYHVIENDYYWTDEMIEGLSEEIEREHEVKIFSEGYDQGYEDGQHDMNEWILPEGFQFKDENGNVINATKIILDKKNDKKEKFLRELSDLLNKYNIDSKMDMPDYVLAEYIWRTLFVNE